MTDRTGCVDSLEDINYLQTLQNKFTKKVDFFKKQVSAQLYINISDICLSNRYFGFIQMEGKYILWHVATWSVVVA